MGFNESSLKNLQLDVRELERRIEDLESQFSSGIQSIEEDHLQEKERLRREKSFVGYLFELNFAQTLDDLFLLFRKELRKIHSLSDPLFVLQWSKSHSQIFYFRGNHLNEKRFGDLNFSASLTSQGTISGDLKKNLANALGKPFGHLFYFKSKMKLIRKFLPEFRFYLVVESLSAVFESTDIEWIQSHLETLNLVLDRKLLEDRTLTLARRWGKTFDDFKDPICIKNLGGEILRSNRSYQECKNLTVFDKKTHILADPLTEDLIGQIEFYISVREFENLMKQDMQNEKMTALGKLAGNIAHELNNPLAGILSMSQILIKEAGSSSQVHQDLKEVEKATRRCQKIIENLIQFSFHDARTMKEQKTEVDDNIAAVMTLLKAKTRAFHLDLQTNTPGYWIKIPSQLFQQVIFNILYNACQVMKEGGHLKVSSTILCIGVQETLQIRVEDDGPGIPEDLKPFIFEPFFTTKSMGEGTGLGLYLSKSIVEKFGGKLYFQDRPQSRGTVFFLEFPVAGQFL